MSAEIWDLYDEQGNKTGETWERSRAGKYPKGGAISYVIS